MQKPLVCSTFDIYHTFFGASVIVSTDVLMFFLFYLLRIVTVPRIFCLRKPANHEPTNWCVACFTLRIGIYVEDAGNNNDGDISSIRVLKLADASTLGEVQLPPKA